MQTFTLFVLGSLATAGIWIIYLYCNNALDKLNPGFVQDILGTIMSFATLMAVGVVLAFAGEEMMLGWFVALVAIGLLAGARKLLRRQDNGALAD